MSMSQRRAEHIAKCLDQIKTEIQESHYDCASCQSLSTLVDVVGWCKEMQADNKRLNEQDAEIKRLTAELAEATNCPDCNGRGKRWYSLYGDATCDLCSGSGKRR